MLFGGGAQHDEVAIDPADITGEIVLRLAFDDVADTLTCSFSLDGGYTYQSPFPPYHVFTATSDGEILLGADTAIPPEPPPPPPPISPICSPGAAITGAKLNVAGRRGGGSRLSFTGRLLVGSGFPVSFDPARDGAQVLLMDVVTQTRFFDLSVPVSIPAGGRGDGCDPRDGWKTVRGSSSTSYIYRNYSNAMPPACIPASAQGLRILSFTDARTSKGKLSVSLAARSTQPYLYVGDQLRGTVVFGGRRRPERTVSAGLRPSTAVHARGSSGAATDALRLHAPCAANGAPARGYGTSGSKPGVQLATDNPPSATRLAPLM